MKTFFIVVLVILAVVIGTGYYFYSQVSYVPEWYETSDPQKTEHIIQSADAVSQQVENEIKSKKTTQINPDQLTSMILSNARKKLPFNPQKAIKGIQTKITKENLAVEAVIDVKKIPQNQIPKQARGYFDQFVQMIPGDAFENLYVKIEGKPVIKNGQLGFDENATVQIGKVNYSIREMAAQFAADKKFQNYIPLSSLPFSDIQIEDGYLNIKQ